MHVPPMLRPGTGSHRTTASVRERQVQNWAAGSS